MIKGLLFLLRYGWHASRRYILCLFGAELLQAVLPLVSLVMPKYILDELLGAQRIDMLALYVGILLAAGLLGGMLHSYLRTESFQARVVVGSAFVRAIARKNAEADLTEMEAPAFQELKKRAETFLYGDWHGFSYVLDQAVSILGKCVVFLGVLAVMAALSPWIVLLFILFVLGSTAVEAWAKAKSTGLSMEQLAVERRGQYLSSLFDDPAYGKEIRLGVLTDWLMARLSRHHQESAAFYARANRYTRKAQYAAGVSGFLQQAVAYAYLTRAVLGGGIGIGSFTMYVGAVGAFSAAMREVLSSIVEIRRYAPYYEATQAYLEIPCTLRGSGRECLPEGPYTITFAGVSYRYPGQERDVLHDITLTLRPGTKLALVGPNGAGKTTFIKLLTRIIDPTEGVILLNGIDIRTLAYDAYMGLFGAVFQDFKLFAMPLLDNVALARTGHIAEDAVQGALEDSGLRDRLAQCPNGLHTQLYRLFDAEGFEPSGGEGQKIALARALVQDAPILVLDEPTAALDPQAEATFFQLFHRLSADKTTVYISHRLASCKDCNEIAVLEGGRLAELGNHETLMAAGGLYAKLFGLQASRYQAGQSHLLCPEGPDT